MMSEYSLSFFIIYATVPTFRWQYKKIGGVSSGLSGKAYLLMSFAQLPVLLHVQYEQNKN